MPLRPIHRRRKASFKNCVRCRRAILLPPKWTALILRWCSAHSWWKMIGSHNKWRRYTLRMDNIFKYQMWIFSAAINRIMAGHRSSQKKLNSSDKTETSEVHLNVLEIVPRFAIDDRNHLRLVLDLGIQTFDPNDLMLCCMLDLRFWSSEQIQRCHVLGFSVNVNPTAFLHCPCKVDIGLPLIGFPSRSLFPQTCYLLSSMPPNCLPNFYLRFSYNILRFIIVSLAAIVKGNHLAKGITENVFRNDLMVNIREWIVIHWLL